MMKWIAWHGLANSEQLHELREAAGEGTDRWWTTKTLNTLHHAGLVRFEPEFGNYTSRRWNYYHIYGRSEHGDKVMEEWGELEDFLRPSGNDKRHQYGIAASTISIHTAALNAGDIYEPGHVHLKGRELGYKGYRPDQLFAITYKSKAENGSAPWYFYALEYERTYPDRNNRVQSKSSDYYDSKIDKVIEYIGKLGYKDHLNTKTAMLALFVFDHWEGERKFHEVLAKKQDRCKFILTQTVPRLEVPTSGDDQDDFIPAGTWPQLYNGPWKRHGYDDYFINTP